jgi:diguanylate cyclase (GGDEF)-like protein
MIIYLAGSLEMVRLTYNAMLSQLTLRQQFEQLARIDPMTGLFNRSVLDSDLVRMVNDRAAGMVAVHAVDLDHFKAANDRFGHPVGDALLKEVAKRLKAIAAQGDLIIRMGGDEFILVQKSVRGCTEAEAMAQRIFETLSSPYCVAGHDIVIGASIGIAVSPDHGQTVDALLSRSDSALYRAKANRGGYVFAGDGPAPEPALPAETASRQFAA